MCITVQVFKSEWNTFQGLMLLWRTISVKQQVCVIEGIQQLFRPARWCPERRSRSPLRSLCPESGPVGEAPGMTGSWLGLKAHPRAAEDRVRCGDAPELLWYVRREQEEHSGKGSTMDAEGARGNSRSSRWKISMHTALLFLSDEQVFFNAKTFWWADIDTVVKVLLPFKQTKKNSNVTIFHSSEIKHNNTYEGLHARPFVWKEPGLQIFVKEIPHGWHRQDEMKAPAGTDWRWCVGTGLSHVPWDKARAKPTDFPSNQPLTKGSPFQPTKPL